MSDNEKKKKSGIAFAVWIVVAILILILYLVNREKILYSLKVTDFFGKVFNSEPEFISNYEIKENDEPLAELEHQPLLENLEVKENSIEKESSTPKSQITLEFTDNSSEKQTEQTVKPDDNKVSGQTESKTEETVKPEEKITPTETAKLEPKQQNVPQMDQHLFFIQIASDGSVLRKEVVRKIDKTNTPLTSAINTLLEGPDVLEVGSGNMSLIPAGTKLLGASVKNGVATLDFSENFLYNKYGVEGFYGQLMQVVFTATAFSNVESVQILIEGSKQDYLGSEGVYIGSPLPRTTFR